MPSTLKFLLAALSSLSLSSAHGPIRHQQPPHWRWRHDAAPSADVANGTYVGVRSEGYDQDFFLGMPYAKPPTGSRRFAAPEALDTAFGEARSATEYGNVCVGYGSDATALAALGFTASEDCLTINVVRPSGTTEGDNLPVAVWVHGGSYVNGGSPDPRYNLSYIVDQSVKEGKPIVAASINYRMSYWGFLFSQEMQDASAGNIGFRDQRMALHWIQDNIAAFGGSPKKVTIWGESAGARSLGMQLVAYDGNYNGLFRSAILESGSSVAKFVTASSWQTYFDALLVKVGCDSADDALTCLRALPWTTLNKVWNGTDALSVSSPTLSAVIDGDFMTAQGSKLLKQGKFAHVPLLLGNNFDEGTGYAKTGINTTAQFQSYLTSLGMDATQVSDLSSLYPDVPSQGIPASYTGRPAAYPYGLQFKRVAAFAGDYQQHSGRRLMAKSFASAGLSVYSYMWNVYVNGIANIYGATHFQEVAFVFDNVEGKGYTANPFEGKPQTFVQLADLMSRMWVSFIHDTNPNKVAHSPCSGGATWPLYKLSAPNNLVFDVNRTDLRYVAKDNYRATEITYLLENVFA